ncbi:MAG: hypothetical protein JNK66_11555, partial [Chitinophagales bacterium]|nr:hypothetical protein [Chitinophagales bacterium]
TNTTSLLYNLTTNSGHNISQFTPPASLLHNDGLNNNDGELCLYFNIQPQCNDTVIPPLKVYFNYVRYCNLNMVLTDSVTLSQRKIAVTTAGAFDGCVTLPMLSQTTTNCSVVIAATPKFTSLSYTWSVPSNQIPPCSSYPCSTDTIIANAYGIYSLTVTYSGGCTRTTQLHVNTPAAGIAVGSGVGLPNVTDAIVNGQLLPATGTGSAANTDQHVRVVGQLAIDIDYTFWNGSTLYCLEGAEILVKQNKKLYITGGTSASSKVVLQGCQTLWKGIKVEPGGQIFASYDTIRDAQYGIRLHHDCRMGVNNTVFDRCFIGVYFNPMVLQVGVPPKLIMHQTGFYGNTFVCDDNVMKPSYSGMMNIGIQPDAASINAKRRTWAGMHLENLSQITIGKNGLTKNSFQRIENGIIMTNGDLTVINAHFNQIGRIYTNPYNGIHDGTCINLTTNQNIQPVYSLYVNGLGAATQFAVNTKRGIYAEGVNISVTNCSFNSNTGVEVRNSHTAEIKIGNECSQPPSNSFTGITNRGIWLVNNDPALTTNIICNDISIIGVAADSTGGRGIEIISNGNAESCAISNNKITLNNYGTYGILLHNCNGPNFNVFNNTVNLNFPLRNRVGIQSLNCNSLGLFSNLVSANNPTTNKTSGGVYYPIAYDCINTGNTYFNCNRSHTIHTGFRFSGINNNLQFSTNEMGLANATNQTGTFGLRVESGATMPAQYHRGNKWWGTFGSGWAARNENFPSNPTAILPFEVHNNSSEFWPITHYPGSLIWFKVDVSSPDVCNAPYVGANYKTDEVDTLNGLEQKVVNQELEFDEFDEQLQWQNEKRVLEELLANTDLISTDINTSLFYNAKTNSPMGDVASSEALRRHALHLTGNGEGDLQQLHQTKDSLLTLSLANDATIDSSATLLQIQMWQQNHDELSTQIADVNNQLNLLLMSLASQRVASLQNAIGLNDAIMPGTEIEMWHKQINGVYMATLALGIDTFTPAQWATICTVAFKCPLQGGEAVYNARALLATVHDTLYDDLTTCTEAGFAYKKEKADKPETTTQNTLQFKFMPNPAKEFVCLQSTQELTDELQLAVMDYTGRIIIDRSIKLTDKKYILSVNEFTTGLYLLKLYRDNSVVYSTTLNIAP